MKTRYSNSDLDKIIGRSCFFDANILLFLFFTTTPYQDWQKYYSSMFYQLLHQKNPLYIDFLVLSEVINRELRIQYELYLWENKISKKNMRFKDFRNSELGNESLEHIYQVIESKIFPLFQFDAKDFTLKEVRDFMTVEPLDFNDKAIERLCKENNMILFTDDKDYAKSEVEIISTNPSIIGFDIIL